MTYKLHITQTAERDLMEAADYIEFSLKNPTAADHLLDAVEEAFISLIQFPKQRPIVTDSVLSLWEIRAVLVNNYIVFCTITGDTIHIVRFLYGRRDWMSILKNSSSSDLIDNN